MALHCFSNCCLMVSPVLPLFWRTINNGGNTTYCSTKDPEDAFFLCPRRCYLTLTQALHLRMGGNPFGPAGTGKTESVKALGAQLGRFVLVFNCDESFDYSAMGRLFAGLCQVRGGVDRRVLECLDPACGCHAGRFHHLFLRDEAVHRRCWYRELINAETLCLLPSLSFS